VTVTRPLDRHLAEDRQVRPGPRCIEAWHNLRWLGGGIAGETQDRSLIAITAEGQERPEEVLPHGQQLPEDDLFDVMNRLLTVGGGMESLDQLPEGAQGLVDGPRTAPLFGRGEILELDGGCGGGEHRRGSSLMRDMSGDGNRPGMYRTGRAGASVLRTASKPTTPW
jgi:hypothetical protein